MYMHICMKIEARLPVGREKTKRMNLVKINASSILGTTYPGV